MTEEQEKPTNEIEQNDTPVVETAVETPKFDGMSTKDAVREASKIIREGKEPPAREAPPAEEPTKKEVTQAVEADPEPPSEFSGKGKTAWKNKDIRGIQDEYRRLNESRTREISRAQRAEREAQEDAKTWKEFGKMAAPYIESRGQQGVPPQQAMMEALALIQEIKKGKPSEVKAELKKIGIDLDAADPNPEQPSNTQLEALQKTVEELKTEREQERLQRTAQTFESAFQVLRAQKNRAGAPVFPDLLRYDEEGNEFARRLGSRTSDPYFRKKVAERFPNADFTVLVREAYIAEYGRVSGEAVQVSTEKKQEHIQKSRRANAALPGRTMSRVNEDNLAGKLSTKAAIRKARELHREH